MANDLSLQVLASWPRSAEFAAAWDRLWELNQASPVLSYDWNRLWWQHHEACSGGEGGLRIFAFWDQAKLVALLPLYEQQREPLRLRTLRFLGTGEERSPAYPEYLDLLCAPEHRAQVLNHLETIFFGPNSPLDCDTLDLGIAAAHGILPQWAEALPVRSRGWLVTRHAKSYYADLSSGFARYVSELSSESRQRARRLLREADSKSTRCTLNHADPAAVLQELVEEHQSYWQARKQAGAYGTPQARRFQIESTTLLLEQGRALLARIHTGIRTEVIILGLRRGFTFEFYISGRGARSSLGSPGITGHLLLARSLAEQGVTRYDFLAGDEPYKRQFASGYQHLVNLRFYKLRPRLLALGVEKLLNGF